MAERYRRFQYGDCSTKRDYGSPIRVTFRFNGRARVICCARVEQGAQYQLPQVVAPRLFDRGARPQHLRRKRRPRCPTLDASVPVFNSVNLLVHNSFRELRVRPRILPEMLLGSSVVWTSAMTPLFKRRLSACAEAESTKRHAGRAEPTWRPERSAAISLKDYERSVTAVGFSAGWSVPRSGLLTSVHLGNLR